MEDKSIRAFSVQCANCLRVIGISVKNFQNEKIFCLKCGKQEIMDLDFEKWEHKTK